MSKEVFIMSKAIIVKNEFASKSNEEKEVRVASLIANLINKSSYDKNIHATK